jgi:hypothetical protein
MGVLQPLEALLADFEQNILERAYGTACRPVIVELAFANINRARPVFSDAEC